MWAGPEDSDEEMEGMEPYINQYEKKIGLKFSKNGLIKFIEDSMANETPS